MTNDQTDYDLIYNTQFDLSIQKFIDDANAIIDANVNRTNYYLRILMMTQVRTELQCLMGQPKGKAENADLFCDFMWGDFDFAVETYKTNPINNYMKFKYQETREACRRPKHFRPDVYELNEVDLVKYVTRIYFYQKLHLKIGTVFWEDNQTKEFFFDGILNNINSYSTWRHPVMNKKKEVAIEEVRIDTKALKYLNSPTSHAVAYLLLNKADHPEFLWEEKCMEAYCRSVNYMISDSLVKMEYTSFRRILYKMYPKIETVRVKYLEAAKKIIQSKNCEAALKGIEALISKSIKDKHS